MSILRDRPSPRSLLLAALLALVAGAGCNDGTISTGNTPPSATILQPSDGIEHSATQPLELIGVAGDSGTAAEDLRVTWTSSTSGVLFDGAPDDAGGNTRFLWESPPIGAHEISLSVLDPGGLGASRTVRVDVIGNTDPTCAITSPTGALELDAGDDVLLQGQVGDGESALTDLAFTWASDRDGELGSGAPNSAGVVSVTTPLSPDVHLLTLTVSDPLGGLCVATVTQTMNGRPSAPGVSFDPASPTTLSDLRAVVAPASTDPEGSDVTYTFAWTEDGAPSLVTGDLVLSSDLDKGEEWRVTVVATDADGFAADPVSASVVVANSLPTAPGVSIAPASPTQAEDLVCAVDAPSTDADADAVTYGFAWELGGSPTGLAGDTLPWDETEPGDFWTCVVTPNDGEGDGAAGAATVQVTAGCASLDLDPASPGAVVIPDDPALRLGTGNFTVEAWVRAEGFGSGESTTIASKRGGTSGDGWHFGIGGVQTSAIGKPVFLVSDLASSSAIGSQQLATQTWTHVAVTYGSGIATLWLNGLNVGSASVPQPSAGTAADLALGADATTGGFVWNGQIDDVRISDVVRYSSTFVPASQLAADADTVAWWGFEEAGGAVARDLSGAGFDGALTGAAGFSGAQSTCTNDQPPTAPAVQVAPDYPLLSQDLTCSLVTSSVDPEGNPVTYAGQWLVNGAPSGQTFTTFPGTLPASLTSEAESWTCSVTASDGGQSGPAGTDSVYTGALPIGALVVPDPASPASGTLTFAPPVAGLVRATLSNPDASRDGIFSVDVLGYGTTWVFTGYRDWAYGGTTVSGWASTDVEFNASPSLGTLTLDLDYSPTPGIDNTGPDTLSLTFVYGAQLSTVAATQILSSTVGPQDTTTSQAQTVLGAGERLLFETVACGFGGGGHSLYADADGVVGNDGIARVDTGFAGNCLIPLSSHPLSSGSWNLTLVNEDDFFADNTDQRAVTVYRYTP
jgi:hypothetical protein